MRTGDLFGIDLRALAALRIGLGVVVLLGLLDRAPMLPLLYADGVLPLREARLVFDLPLALHLADASVAFQALLFALAGAAALALVVGWHARLACAGVWYLQLSLHQRNPFASDVGDMVLILLLFWSIWLPIGRRWSLDARGGARRRARVLSVASAALLLQTGCIYFFSFLHKVKQDVWRDGSAVRRALDDDFWLRPLGEWALQHDALLEWLTYATLCVESLAPLLLFSPVARRSSRALAIAALIGFQIGLGSMLELGWIPLVMSLALLPFVPSVAWDALERGLPAARGAAAPDPADREPPIVREHGFAQALAGVALAYVLVANVDDVADARGLPSSLRSAAFSVGLNQGWVMYASPPEGNGRLVLRARLADGERTTLVVGHDRPGWPDDGERFAPLETLWNDYRGRMMVDGVMTSRRALHGMLDWLCREWRERHPQRAIERITAKQKVRRGPSQRVAPGEERTLVHNWTLLRKDCPGQRRSGR